MESVDVIRVVPLIALYLSHHHLCVHDGILAKALPDTRPAGIAAKVNHGVIHPRAVGSAALIGSDLSTRLGQFRIERCCQVDRLGEEYSALCISHTMILVEAIDVRNTEILHRLLLNQTDPLLPLFHCVGTCAGRVEYRPHFPFRDTSVEHCLIELPHRCRSSLAVILNGHLSHHVEVQFEHLTDLLVKVHLRERLFNLRLNFLIPWNGRFQTLCIRTNSKQCPSCQYQIPFHCSHFIFIYIVWGQSYKQSLTPQNFPSFFQKGEGCNPV